MSIKIEVTGDTAVEVRDEFARLFGRTEQASFGPVNVESGSWGSTGGSGQNLPKWEDEPEPQPVRTQEHPDDVPTGMTNQQPDESDETPEELYGGSGKVRSTNAKQLKNEILQRINHGHDVADDQIGRLPAKEKEAVREAQRNAAPAEKAPEPEPEQPAEPEAAAEEPAGEQTYSLDDVQTEIIRIHKDLGDPGLTRAREVFAKHGNGATKRSQIPAECVDAVVTALKEIGES